jgi:hypothetical protein
MARGAARTLGAMHRAFTSQESIAGIAPAMSACASATRTTTTTTRTGREPARI